MVKTRPESTPVDSACLASSDSAPLHCQAECRSLRALLASGGVICYKADCHTFPCFFSTAPVVKEATINLRKRLTGV